MRGRKAPDRTLCIECGREYQGGPFDTRCEDCRFGVRGPVQPAISAHCQEGRHARCLGWALDHGLSYGSQQVVCGCRCHEA